ncbi:MAG: alpha/beta hydrolase [Candidatus Eremiobacteraeota bacterium]|nr:alpha/beta hydrolase [Candidatus Eremiobacteraeota bacterium]
MTVPAAALGLALVFAIFAPSANIQRISNISYIEDGSDAHKLDFFLPDNRPDAPLVVFIHGGAFLGGSRREVAAVGIDFAHQGLATAVVSYRLFPSANAKEATQDVATAIAWVMRHAADYGIHSRKVFVVGHSAGAQIAALIGTNAHYLETAGLTLQSIGSVFAVSGAYDLRDLSDEPDSWQRVDGHIYGETPQQRADVSPSQHIDAAAPPIEIACGTEQDNPGSCDRALYFQRALVKAGINTKLIKENGASHLGMLACLINPKDPLNAEFLDLIARTSP